MRKIKIFNLLGVITLTTLILASTVFSTPMSVTQLTTDKWGDDWRPYGAYVDEVLFVVYTEGETPLAMLALAKGEVDACDERVLNDYQWSLIIDENINVTFTPSVRYRALTLDSSHFPTNITAFRRAIAFSFDKYRANQECIGGVGQPQDSYIPLISTEWSVEGILPTKFYDTDFIEGNKSLENAGFKDLDGDGWREYDTDGSGTWTAGDRDHDEYTDEGGIMSMFATAGYDPAIIACQIAQEGLAEMGVRSEVVEMDIAVLFDELFAGNAWVACWTEGVSRVNTVKLLYDNFAIGGAGNVEPYNYYHFTNQTISNVLEEMVASNNITFIKEKAEEASLMLAFEQPQIVCHNDVNIGAFRTDRFDGFFESAGAGWTNGDNWAAATKVHLKESLGGPYGGTFRYILSDNMNTLNPYLQQTRYDATVFQYIYETLWNVHPHTWDPMPGLAYDWDIETTVASGDILDGQKFTFYLYQNETWHDGTPFTSADVNHSIYMWRDSPFVNPEMDDIYKIVLPDAYTIELYVDKAGFFEFADTTSFYITPQHIWKDVTNVTSYTPTQADMIGTGPYYMNARVPGEYISLLRHEDWRWSIREVDVPHNLQPFRVLSPVGGEILGDNIAIQWTSSEDPYNHNVTYTVFYSADNGSSWVTLASNLTTTSYVWDSTTVIDRTEYLVRVNASCSEESWYVVILNSTFTIDNVPLTTTDFPSTQISNSSTQLGTSFLPVLQIFELGTILFFVAIVSGTSIYYVRRQYITRRIYWEQHPQLIQLIDQLTISNLEATIATGSDDSSSGPLGFPQHLQLSEPLNREMIEQEYYSLREKILNGDPNNLQKLTKLLNQAEELLKDNK